MESKRGLTTSLQILLRVLLACAGACVPDLDGWRAGPRSGRLGPPRRPDSGSAQGGKVGAQGPTGTSRDPGWAGVGVRALLACRGLRRVRCRLEERPARLLESLTRERRPCLDGAAVQPTGNDIPSQWGSNRLLGVPDFRSLSGFFACDVGVAVVIF